MNNLEPLERRRMLTTSVPFGVNAHGTLHIDGTASADVISVLVIAKTEALVSFNQLHGFKLTGFKRIGISGAGGGDFIKVSGHPAITFIIGGGGNDRIVSGGTSLQISGGEGNDRIIAVSPAGVTLLGGRGSDTLYGSDGNDMLFGGAGDDVMEGGAGGDSVFGNEGSDNLGTLFSDHDPNTPDDVGIIEEGDTARVLTE
jgi:Ca2+-binding RTX toxin-like protein